MAYNQTHPFLPDYTGPTTGWYTFLYHEQVIGYSDNVLERRDDVLANKPAHEQRVRALACQVIPPEQVPTAYTTAQDALETACLAHQPPSHACITWGTDHTPRAITNPALDAYRAACDALEAARAAYCIARATLDTAWLLRTFPETDWRLIYDESVWSLRFPAATPLDRTTEEE